MKITQKELRQRFNTYKVPFKFKWLFEGLDAMAYTEGMYGWYSDVYCLTLNLCFSIGNKPCGKELPKQVQNYLVEAKGGDVKQIRQQLCEILLNI